MGDYRQIPSGPNMLGIIESPHPLFQGAVAAGPGLQEI